MYLNGKHGWCGKVFIWNLQCIDGHPSVLEQEREDNHVAVHGSLVGQCAVVFVKGDGIDLLSIEHATLEGERERERERERECVCVHVKEGFGHGEMGSQ